MDVLSRFAFHLPTRAALLGILLAISSLGCNLPYYVENGTEQAKLMLGRRYIRDILNSSERTAEEQGKLRLILDARNFARSLGLNPRGSYTTYRDLPSDKLTWVVMGTPPDSFTPYLWKFPIVGEVPYKGYFSESDAREEAKRIESEGFESYVRSSDAISTLGWFDDPVLSSILKKEPHQVVDTIFHELFHANVWVPGHVDFNESLATFVGSVSSVKFFEEGNTEISNLKAEVKTSYLSKSRKSLSGVYWLADGLTRLYGALDQLYKSNISREEKLQKRQGIYKEYKEKYFPQVPEEALPSVINNSAILQIKIYYTRMKDIQKFFVKCDRSIPDFLRATKRIAETVSNNTELSPFDEMVNEGCK